MSRNPPTSARHASAPRDFLRPLLALILIVVVLYFGKPVIVPLALAVLFAFILNPMVRAVERRRTGRILAVLIVMLFSMFVCAVIAYGVGSQIATLADELPAHKSQIRDKFNQIRSSSDGSISRLMATFREATKAPAASTVPAANHKTIVATVEPVPATQPDSSPIDHLLALANIFLEPVASAGLILILVIFLLIKREDVRNRLIGLLGHGQLAGTTRVLVESAERVSRLLFMQLCVNAAFGFVFGTALFFIGVPYCFLWGFLTAVLRFVPYVGSWLAAALPVLLSFAIAPGWGQPLLVLAVFISLDLTTANVLEPLLFGHTTGISPVALLVAAVFWTWIWGPIGLLLSTPLTVCLVVLGQHVPRLGFLSLLLGDQPALAPAAAFYQRLLAGDKDEALQLATAQFRNEGIEPVANDILLPTLQFARRDRKRSGLSAQDETFIADATAEVLAQLRDAAAKNAPALIPASRPGEWVLGLPAHHRMEEIALALVAAALAPAGVLLDPMSTRNLPADVETRISKDRPALLFIAIIPPRGITQARYLCRRLRKQFPDLPIVVGCFGHIRDFDGLLSRLRAAGATYLTTSISQTRTQLLALLAAPPGVPCQVDEGRGGTAGHAAAEAPSEQVAPQPAAPAHATGTHP